MSAYNLILDAVIRAPGIASARRDARRHLGLALLAGTWAGACSEPATARPEHVIPGPALTAEVADGSTVQCPPRPNVRAQTVEPGSDLDVNGNGIVCEEGLAPAGLPGFDTAPPLVMDDAIMPTSEE